MTRHSLSRVPAVLLTAGALLASVHAGAEAQARVPAANTLTAKQQASGWKLLFDGRTLDGWRGYRSSSAPKGWSVENGVLVKRGPGEDLVSTDKYGNFELQLDWKLSPGGNSGVLYRGTEEYDHIYWSAPEYQLLDDARHPDGKLRLTAAGSDYAVYPSPKGYVHPANHWNHTRIVVNGNHVEHWLNGHRMVSYELGSPDWQARVKKSKFAAYPNYGKASTGLIAIQGDHDGTLAVRNIKIRVLP